MVFRSSKKKHLFLISFLVSILFCAYMYGYKSFTKSVSSEKPKSWSLVRGLAQTSPPDDPEEPWIETLSWSPRVFLYHHLLKDEECDEIIDLAGKNVSRSKVYNGENVEAVENTDRTSNGVFLDSYMKQSPLLRDIERRIAEWTKLPVENGESFYLLRYELGQEYKAHVDFFYGPSAEEYMGEEGNRCATVLLYLHTPDEGGETTFPIANLLVPAKKGNAVLFWNLGPDNKGDFNALHVGTPVLKGVKWAMTKWIAENKVRHYSTKLTEKERIKIEIEDKLYLESKTR